MDWIKAHLLMIVVAALPIGMFAAFLFQTIKRQIAWVDGLPPALKMGAVFVIGAAITALGNALGVPIVCEDGVNCLAKLDQGTLKLLLEAGLSLVVAKLTHKTVLQKPKG